MKKLFEIVWCFVDENGVVYSDWLGEEEYHVAYIKAGDIDEAERIWRKRINFKKEPELVEINTFVQV